MSVAEVADRYITKDGRLPLPRTPCLGEAEYTQGLQSRIAVLEQRVDILRAENDDLRDHIHQLGYGDDLLDMPDHTTEVFDEDLTARGRLAGRKIHDVLDYSDELEEENIRLTAQLRAAQNKIADEDNEWPKLRFWIIVLTVFLVGQAFLHG